MAPLRCPLVLCTLLAQMFTLSLAAPSQMAFSIKAPVEYSGFAAILQVLYHLPGLKAKIYAHQHVSLEMRSLTIILDKIQSSPKAIKLEALANELLHLDELEYDTIMVQGEGPVAIFSYLLTDCLSWMADSFGRTSTIGELPFSLRSDSIWLGDGEISLADLEYLVVDVAPTADMVLLSESLNYEMFSKTDPFKLEVVILRAVHPPHTFSVLVRRNGWGHPSQWLYLNGLDTNFISIPIDDQLPHMMLDRYQAVMLFYAKPFEAEGSGAATFESPAFSELELALNLDDNLSSPRSSSSSVISDSWTF